MRVRMQAHVPHCVRGLETLEFVIDQRAKNGLLLTAHVHTYCTDAWTKILTALNSRRRPEYDMLHLVGALSLNKYLIEESEKLDMFISVP